MDVNNMDNYEYLIEQLAFERKVEKLRKIQEELRQIDIAWLEAAMNNE